MTSRSSKHRTNKSSLFLLSGFLLFLLIFNFSINVVLSKSRNTILKNIHDTVDSGIGFKRLLYIFPNVLTVTDLRINTEPDHSVVTIPLTVTKFSIPDILIKHKLKLTHLTFKKADFDGEELLAHYDQWARKVAGLFKKFPPQNFDFKLNEASIHFDKTSPNKFILANFDFVFSKNGNLTSRGSFYTDRRELIFNHHLKGNFISDRFILKTLEIKRDNLDAQVWGEEKKGKVVLQGYLLMNTFLADLSKVNLHLLDINCVLMGGVDHLDIEHFTATLNHIPILVGGRIVWDQGLHFSLQGSAAFSKLQNGGFKNLQKISSQFDGYVKEKNLQGNGSVEIFLTKDEQASFPLTNITFAFQNLQTLFHQYPKIRFHLDTAQLSFLVGQKWHKLGLNHLMAVLNMQNKRYQSLHFSTPFYDGTAEGRLWMDTAGFFPRLTSRVKLFNVNSMPLNNLLIPFADVQGPLSSQIFFKNYPDLNFNGYVQFKEGTIKNFQFFDWLAKYFDLPSLQTNPFKEFNIQFTSNTKLIELTSIKLVSKNLQMQGYFKIRKNNRVSSALSVNLSRNLMAESPRLKPLLARLKNRRTFPFDFQLSGRLEKMNFQWKDSELKREIQAKIPNFIERRIERKIENNLESKPATAVTNP